MELQFQTQPKEVPKQRERKRNTNNKTKFVGVRQRPSGKWVAEIKNTTQKIRMWLGTFDTAEEAARAYDEAACLLRGSNTRTNFVDQIPPNSALSLKIRNLLHQKKCQKQKPTKTIITQNNTTKISSYNGCSNNITSPNGSSFLKQDVQVFTDAYKPDLSNFNGGFEMGNSQFDYSSLDFDVMSTGFYGIVSNQEDGFEVPKISSISDVQIPDYERMKVERQISASLYAMNGVNEYWENVHDCSADGFWDLPMMCQMFYLS